MKRISIISLLLLIAVPAIGIAAFFCNWSTVLFYVCAGITLLGSLGEWATDKISFVCAIICVAICMLVMQETVVIEMALGVMAASVACEVFAFIRRLAAVH